jgi:hypothetical protein
MRELCPVSHANVKKMGIIYLITQVYFGTDYFVVYTRPLPLDLDDVSRFRLGEKALRNALAMPDNPKAIYAVDLAARHFLDPAIA